MSGATATVEQIARAAAALGENLASLTSTTGMIAEYGWKATIHPAVLEAWNVGGEEGVQALMDGMLYGQVPGQLKEHVGLMTNVYWDTAKASTGQTLTMLDSVSDAGDFWTSAPGFGESLGGKGVMVSRDAGAQNLTMQLWARNQASSTVKLRLVQTLSDMKAALVAGGPSNLGGLMERYVGSSSADVATMTTKAHLLACETYASHLDHTARDETGKPPSASSKAIYPHNIVGWRRVTEPGACMFCLVASTQRYKNANLRPLHPHCRCSVAPIVGKKDPGQVINKGLLKELNAGQYKQIKRNELRVEAAYKAAMLAAGKPGADLKKIVDQVTLKSMQEQLINEAAKLKLDDYYKTKLSETISSVTGVGITPALKSTKAYHSDRVNELIAANKNAIPTPAQLKAIGDAKAHAANVAAALKASGATQTAAVTSALTRSERMMPSNLTFREELERLRGTLRGEFDASDLHDDVAKRMIPRAKPVRAPTSAEILAMETYQGNNFFGASNKYLRLGGRNASDGVIAELLAEGIDVNSSKFQSTLHHLDKAVKTDVLTVDTVLYRGFGTKIDKVTGKSFPDSLNEAWLGDKKVPHQGYASASFNPGVGKRFATEDVLAIRCPAGTLGSVMTPHTGMYATEQEFLLGRGGTFTIVEKEQMSSLSGETWTIWHVDYVGGDEQWDKPKPKPRKPRVAKA